MMCLSAGEGLSGEQEVDEDIDEEEVKELQEAAGRELRAAAAAVFGLPFEDKVKLVGALPPAAAAALTGILLYLLTYSTYFCFGGKTFSLHADKLWLPWHCVISNYEKP
jgi:hypothetical protein